MSAIDLEGQIFGRLTAVARAENSGRRTRWRCKCSCGNRCVALTGRLRRGQTRSCGCLRRELAATLAAARWGRGTPLTTRQRRLLAFLQSSARPPTLREICAHMGCSSTNNIGQHLRALERKGYVEHVGGKARASWRVLRQVAGVTTPAVALQLIRGALNANCDEADTLTTVRAIAFEREEVSQVPGGLFRGQKVNAPRLRLEWTSYEKAGHTEYEAEVRGRFRRVFGLLVQEWPGQSQWLVNGHHDHAPTAAKAMRAAEEYALDILSEGLAAVGPARRGAR
jgi:hypothetical protein